MAGGEPDLRPCAATSPLASWSVASVLSGRPGIGCRTPNIPECTGLLSVRTSTITKPRPQGCRERRVADGDVPVIGNDKHIALEAARVCGDERIEMAGRLLLSLDEHLHAHGRGSTKTLMDAAAITMPDLSSAAPRRSRRPPFSTGVRGTVSHRLSLSQLGI